MDAAATLYERDIKQLQNGDLARTRLLSSFHYDDKEQMVTLGFSPAILPVLNLIHKDSSEQGFFISETVLS